MRRYILIVLALALILALAFGTIAQAAGPNSGRVRAMVAFYPTVNEPARDVLLAKFGGEKYRDLPIIDGAVVFLPLPAVSALAGEAGVKFVELDQTVTAFPKPPPTQPAEVLPTGVNRIDAELNSNKGTGIKVAVIDTGIDYTHPDLAANYKGGIDYVNDDADPKDDNGHGTHVAGIIAARDNDIGVMGVAPEAWLYAVKVLNSAGSGWISDIAAGIGWATDPNGDGNTSDHLDVANLSLGAKGTSTALHTAVINATNAGVTLVVAAGNDAADADAYIPATYDEVITVSAIADFDGLPGGLAASRYFGNKHFPTEQKDDAFAYFSNFGADIDLAAPGVSIKSTWTGGTYKTISGTSMAAPHVAGAAALYIYTQHPAPADVNGDGVATVTEVVRQALQTAGWHSSDGLTGGYFTGDPDGIPEPLVKAATL